MNIKKHTTKPSNNTSLAPNMIRIAALIGIGLSIVINPAYAETSNSSNQNSQTSPAKKPADGKGKLPTFAEADVNGDHFVTKSELQNFPYLLQTFDKVDAGNDGKLEQHEYQNLKMETKREGEVK
ncbi:EF-hand domain-containing protein [Methylomonas sp. LL1]|uniref:EF-hand domain-containing protein n=1 Tax=Methylomonas sp. LL1 TaxID=2785785 RepID=UPI0018C3B5B7|nr:EF-hand domain-containing protein [Methylomonas sp. LL1]QPK61601.1 EF-hand domain-containing protein [Methylomonas sp. LL1]